MAMSQMTGSCAKGGTRRLEVVQPRADPGFPSSTFRDLTSQERMCHGQHKTRTVCWNSAELEELDFRAIYKMQKGPGRVGCIWPGSRGDFHATGVTRYWDHTCAPVHWWVWLRSSSSNAGIIPGRKLEGGGSTW